MSHALGQVITLAVRTPLTKARKGGLKDTRLDDLLISLLTVCWNSRTRQVCLYSLMGRIECA